MSEESLFVSIGDEMQDAVPGQLFGKTCFKINGKAFICFLKNEMVFKLSGYSHKKALALTGAQLFDPSGKKRPMKEWVQVPSHYHDNWKFLATEALQYVSKP
jgi:hypothetical protein